MVSPFYKSKKSVTNTREVFEERARDMALIHPCLYRVSHCSWTPNTTVVWMADNWWCCPHRSMDTDNDFLNRTNSWQICFPLARDEEQCRKCKKQGTQLIYLLPTLPQALRQSPSMSALLTSAFVTLVKKNPSLKSTTTHLECNLSLPVLKLEISVALQEKNCRAHGKCIYQWKHSI